MTPLLMFWTALQVGPPEKPATDYDPANPRSVVEHVAYATRTQKSYEATWKGRLAVPRGDPLDYQGRCVWARPGILYSHYTASGGDEKKIVRAGALKAWVHNSIVGWVTADEAGNTSALSNVASSCPSSGVNLARRSESSFSRVASAARVEARS